MLIDLSHHTKPKTLAGIKSLAKKVKRDNAVPHHQALNEAAKYAGFSNYLHAQKTLGASDGRGGAA